MLLSNKKDPQLEGVYSTKTGGIWNLTYDISSPEFYKFLIKTELKGDIYLYIENFYNNLKTCLTAVTRIQEDPLTTYQYIKIHSEFE